FDQALANMVEALRAVGARPLHVVDIRVHTTSMNTYRINLTALNSIYRRHMGRHSPPLTAVGVTELLDADALVEVMCTAVVPEPQDKTLLVEEVARKVEISDDLGEEAFEAEVEAGAARPRGHKPAVRRGPTPDSDVTAAGQLHRRCCVHVVVLVTGQPVPPHTRAPPLSVTEQGRGRHVGAGELSQSLRGVHLPAVQFLITQRHHLVRAELAADMCGHTYRTAPAHR